MTQSTPNGTPITSIVGIILIFFLGLAGSLIPPILAKHLPGFDLNRAVGFRFFNGLAAGIVLAVGYIHSLPDAAASWEDVAGSSESLTDTYAWFGFIAMMGGLMCFFVEEVVHRKIADKFGLHEHEHGEHNLAHNHDHNHYHGPAKTDLNKSSDVAAPVPAQEKAGGSQVQKPPTPEFARPAFKLGTSADTMTKPVSSELERSMEVIKADLNKSADFVKVDMGKSVEMKATTSSVPPLDLEKGTTHAHKQEDHDVNKADYFTELWVLFIGLSFHSTFVGLALGLNPNDWGLFAAIVFHQFFEGLALGARVARAAFKKELHFWLLDLAYALTVPIGIAIGMGIISNVENGSRTYSIINGTFQALSGGILIYVSFVHMMKEEMGRPEFKGQSGKKLLYALCLGFAVGAGAMSVIGIWA